MWWKLWRGVHARGAFDGHLPRGYFRPQRRSVPVGPQLRPPLTAQGSQPQQCGCHLLGIAHRRLSEGFLIFRNFSSRTYRGGAEGLELVGDKLWARMLRLMTGTLLAVGFVLLLGGRTLALNAKADVIEDINAQQLENLVAENDYVAVYWCKCPWVALRSVCSVKCCALSVTCLSGLSRGLLWGKYHVSVGHTSSTLSRLFSQRLS